MTAGNDFNVQCGTSSSGGSRYRVLTNKIDESHLDLFTLTEHGSVNVELVCQLHFEKTMEKSVNTKSLQYSMAVL